MGRYASSVQMRTKQGTVPAPAPAIAFAPGPILQYKKRWTLTK